MRHLRLTSPSRHRPAQGAVSASQRLGLPELEQLQLGCPARQSVERLQLGRGQLERARGQLGLTAPSAPPVSQSTPSQTDAMNRRNLPPNTCSRAGGSGANMCGGYYAIAGDVSGNSSGERSRSKKFAQGQNRVADTYGTSGYDPDAPEQTGSNTQTQLAMGDRLVPTRDELAKAGITSREDQDEYYSNFQKGELIGAAVGTAMAVAIVGGVSARAMVPSVNLEGAAVGYSRCGVGGVWQIRFGGDKLIIWWR